MAHQRPQRRSRHAQAASIDVEIQDEKTRLDQDRRPCNSIGFALVTLAFTACRALLAPIFCPRYFVEIWLPVQLQRVVSQYIESQPHAEIFAVELVALQLVTLP